MKLKLFTLLIALFGISAVNAQNVSCNGSINTSVDMLGDVYLTVDMIEESSGGVDSLWLDIWTLNCDNIGSPTTVTLFGRITGTGDVVSCTAEVTVDDFIPPVAVGDLDVTVTLDDWGVYVFTGDELDDGSYDNCTDITLSASPAELTCDSPNPELVTLTVTDEYGNMNSVVVDVYHESEFSGTLTCNTDFYINVLSGPVTIVPEMVLELGGPYPCWSEFSVEVEDENGNIIPGNIVDMSHVGTSVTIMITHIATGEACWSLSHIVASGSIYGMCAKDNEGSGIEGVKFNVVNITDETGCTSVSESAGTVVTASLDDDPTIGLDEVDIMIIREHILGMISLSGEQLLAADLSDPNGGTVSSLDLVYLQKLIDGEILAESGWRFVDSSFPFETDVAPTNFPEFITVGGTENYEFRAIKMGDVDLSYDDLIGDDDKTALKTQDVVLNLGETYTVDITMTEAKSLVTANVSFPVATDEYLLKNITSNVPDYVFDPNLDIKGEMAHFRFVTGEEATLGGGFAFDEDDVLFSIEIEATANGILHNTFQLSDLRASKLKVSTAMTGEELKLEYDNFITVPVFNTEYNETVNIFPNPVQTALQLNSTEIELAGNSYTISDITGKIMTQGTVSSEQVIDVVDLNSGVYSIRIGKNIKPILFVKN